MINIDKARTSRILYWVSIALYLLSLIPPAYCTEKGCYDPGVSIFLVLLGVFTIASPGGFPWLANVFYFILLGTRSKKQFSFVLSTLALALSLSFLSVKSVLADESGSLTKITAYKAGYWLWLSSMIVAFIASTYNYIVIKSKSLSGHN